MEIKYNAKLLEVNDNIEQLEELGIKTEKYKNTIENIKLETTTEVDRCYQMFHKVDSNCFLQESLIKIYTDAINSLNKINDSIITQYENYYEIKMEIKQLERKLKNVNKSDINSLIVKGLELLKKIKSSNIVAYDEVKEIVESAYKFFYKLLKTEIVYTDSNNLLNYIKSDSTDTSYIVKLIKDDIKKASQDDEQLINKVQEIRKNGFNDVYFINRELIALLSFNDNDVLINKVKKDFIEKINCYNDLSNSLAKEKDNSIEIVSKIEDIKKYNKKLNWKILLRKVFFILNFCFLTSSILEGITTSKKITETKEYKTITTTYDSTLPTTDPIIEYLPATSNSRTLVEYSPWEEPGYFRDKYTRNVYTYNLDGLDTYYENVEDYLTSDIKEYITVSSEVEYSVDKPEEDYSENKYVINQVYQDKENYNIVNNTKDWIAMSIILSIGIITIDSVLIKTLSKNKLKNLKLQKKENESEIQKNEQLLLESNQHMNVLTGKLFDLKTEIQEEYATLPNILKQEETIKRKILTLDDLK